MAKPGARNSLTDIAGLSVGCAHDARVGTGVTVIVPEARAVCAIDVCGGGPGTRESDALAPESLVDAVDAIVLAGGSVYGLGAADGVAAAMGAEGKGFGFDIPGVPRSPIIPAAILYDLANGGDKAWGDAPPYNALGRAAYAARGSETPLGVVGAGFGAMAGTRKGGQGSVSIVSADGVTVAALTCVNSWGSVTMPGGDCFWAWPFEIDGEFGGVRPRADARGFDLENWDGAKFNPQPRTNTTLCVVATDARLTPAECKRVAQMASAGMARAIRPVFAPFDGDVVFALATGAREAAEPRAFSIARIGALAADCLARAIARGIYHAGGS